MHGRTCVRIAGYERSWPWGGTRTSRFVTCPRPDAQFMMMVFFRVLTPLQLAHVAVQTAPTNKLDTLALAKCAGPTARATHAQMFAGRLPSWLPRCFADETRPVNPAVCQSSETANRDRPNLCLVSHGLLPALSPDAQHSRGPASWLCARSALVTASSL